MARKLPGMPRRAPRLLLQPLLLAGTAALLGLRGAGLPGGLQGGALVGAPRRGPLPGPVGGRAPLIGRRQHPLGAGGGGAVATRHMMEFGMHRGKSFEEVRDQDPAYCKWILAQAERDDALPCIRQFAAWLQGAGITASNGEAALQIDFGKHRGKTFQEVRDQDPSYCEWVLLKAEMGDATESLQQFAAWLQASGITASNGEAALQIDFGKHRGKTFQDVRDQDPSYCEWVLLRAEMGNATNSLQQFAAWLQTSGFTAFGGEVASRVSFGKHRGKSFQEVRDQDPEYCKWLMMQVQMDDAAASSPGREFADWLKATGFTPAIGDAASQMVFGKHKGKSFQEVRDQDPEYSEWLMMQVEMDGAASASPGREFADWLKATGFTPATGDAASQVTFGKHEGKSFQEVRDQDPEYCEWIMMQVEMDDASTASSLRRFADWLKATGFTPTIGDAASQMTFGKHRGKTFQEVRDQDPEYCEWLMMQVEMDGAAVASPGREFADWLKATGFTPTIGDAASQMTFGKHRGKTFQEVRDQDPEYCEWLMMQVEIKYGAAYTSGRQFADWLKATGFTPTIGDAASQMTFGKHKGKTFQEVRDQDPEYCEWLMIQVEINDGATSGRQFADWLKATGFTPTIGDAASQMTFGKHRGKTFQEVRDQDPEYCEWLMTQVEMDGGAAASPLRQFAEWLKATGFTPATGDAASEMPFGQHKGKSFQEVRDQDPEYCEWVLTQADIGDTSPSFKRFADWLKSSGFVPCPGRTQ